MDIIKLIKTAVKRNATNVSLVVGSPPFIRTCGTYQPIEGWPILTNADVIEALDQITTDAERRAFDESKELDFAYTVEDVIRLRCNAALQLNGTSLSIRLLPIIVPSIDELELPAIYKTLVARRMGIIVVAGPTDSGKSTTLATMIDHLNSTGGYNIITIEDPIEYIYSGKMSTITQRQLGNHTNSFPEALKHALRQSPDVILVGEIRDTATAAAVITLAESGNLVLTTSHAPSATHAIERIVDMFPPADREFVQTRLSSLLLAILSQILVPRSNKAGRIAAAEIMIVDDSIRNLIREGKFFQLPNAMVGHHDIGTTTMEESLKTLLGRGLINKGAYDNFHKSYMMNGYSKE